MGRAGGWLRAECVLITKSFSRATSCLRACWSKQLLPLNDLSISLVYLLPLNDLRLFFYPTKLSFTRRNATGRATFRS